MLRVEESKERSWILEGGGPMAQIVLQPKTELLDFIGDRQLYETDDV